MEFFNFLLRILINKNVSLPVLTEKCMRLKVLAVNLFRYLKKCAFSSCSYNGIQSETLTENSV
jgi:hypothetical protein